MVAVELDFEKGRGLVPAVVQDAVTREVRMLGYVNAEALKLTLETGLAHFYSRSRGRIWMKGETSGNVLEVLEVVADCDRDAVLVKAVPQGPTCHTGARSCFHNGLCSRAGEVFRRLVEDAFSRALVLVKEYVGPGGRDCYLYVVNPFTDNIPPPSPLLVSLTADRALGLAPFEEADKVVVPEALGLPFGSVIAVRAGKPMAVVRKRSYGIPGEVSVEYASGYERGVYYVYGVEEGDRVVLVDDAVSTGGTMVAVIEALRSLGAEVLGAVAILSKPQYGGEREVWDKTGVRVACVLRLYVDRSGRLRVEDPLDGWSFEVSVPVIGGGGCDRSGEG